MYNLNYEFEPIILNIFLLYLGQSLEELNGYGTFRPKNIISSILGTPGKGRHLPISNPHDFRQVENYKYSVDI